MKVKVMVRAPYIFIPKGIDENGFLEIPAESTVSHVLRKMRMPKIIARMLLVSVNGQLVKGNAILNDGDTIGFFSGLIGG